jgi:RNA ligase (TIGR02306 family)
MQLFSPGVVNINFEESCMSFFGVEERVISGVFPIPNRDRIQRITLEGLDLTLVAGPGRFVGEKVMYIPIDAILPEKLITELGLVGRLAGKNKNRVKTQKMGSYYSQGLTGPIGLDYSGITKNEPPELFISGGLLLPLPEHLSKYDIENAGRHPKVIEYLMDKKVRILEKMEGCNASVTWDGSRLWINQRENTIVMEEGQEHFIDTVVKENGLDELVKSLFVKDPCSLYFEVCGAKVLGDYYKIGKRQPFVFDIKIGRKFMDGEQLFECVQKKLAPIVGYDTTLREWLKGSDVISASNGKSFVNPNKLREGIVITPMKEEYSEDLGGRLIIKIRSPEYLSSEAD